LVPTCEGTLLAHVCDSSSVGLFETELIEVLEIETSLCRPPTLQRNA